MFENKQAMEKRKAISESDNFTDYLLGKKRLFGDEMGQYGPIKYLDIVKEERWLASRAKISDRQRRDMLKAKADVRIGAVSPGNVRQQKQLKNNDKAVAKQQVNTAKELFLTWDGDGEGSLSPEELMNAFVKVGLSQDHHFAKKIIESIRPSGSDKNEDIQIPDFVKIFRHDEVSDNVTK